MPRKPKHTRIRQNQKDDPGVIRMTIFVDARTYDWLVRSKRSTGETFGRIVGRVVKNEVNRIRESK